MKLPYSEGTLFFVPLRRGGYARGVVARASSKGKVLFGYFFGPRLPSPDVTGLRDLNPPKALLRLRFGDLGLINGEWPIREQIPHWDRTAWPMPEFMRKDPLGMKKPVIVRYSDTDPGRVEVEFTATDDCGELEADSMAGYGAVEDKLSKFLGD